MKIVIDSSVWIAGTGSSKGHASAVIFKSYKSPNIEIFISSQILDEISRNLILKLKFDEAQANKARTTVKNLCDNEIGLGKAEINAIRTIKYPKDKHILALCHKIQADCLVTFDRKHLLPLVKFGKTEIVEPKNFIGIFS